MYVHTALFGVRGGGKETLTLLGPPRQLGDLRLEDLYGARQGAERKSSDDDQERAYRRALCVWDPLCIHSSQQNVPRRTHLMKVQVLQATNRGTLRLEMYGRYNGVSSIWDTL